MWDQDLTLSIEDPRLPIELVIINNNIYLIAHFENTIRIAGAEITNDKIDAFFNPNPKKTQQIVHYLTIHTLLFSSLSQQTGDAIHYQYLS